VQVPGEDGEIITSTGTFNVGFQDYEGNGMHMQIGQLALRLLASPSERESTGLLVRLPAPKQANLTELNLHEFNSTVRLINRLACYNLVTVPDR
jgi:hypothetical protein